jgi:hypothetical protein
MPTLTNTQETTVPTLTTTEENAGPTSTGPRTYIGPATVVAAAGDRLRLALPDRQVWARLALAFSYQPEPEDRVLVAGEEDFYVIGVLEGRGRTVLSVPGDLEVSAGGRLHLTGARGIEVSAPEITLKADRFETVARTAFEKFVNCYRTVRETLQTTSKRNRTVTEEQYSIEAGQICALAEKDVRIDGEQINLG